MCESQCAVMEYPSHCGIVQILDAVTQGIELTQQFQTFLIIDAEHAGIGYLKALFKLSVDLPTQSFVFIQQRYVDPGFCSFDGSCDTARSTTDNCEFRFNQFSFPFFYYFAGSQPGTPA